MVYVDIRPMDKHPVEKGIEDVVRTYELLDRVRLGRDIVIRDDQFDREALFDAARTARSQRIRVNLLDTGRFEPAELEWLIQEKVRVSTSDEARPREDELSLLLKACLRARSFLAYLHNGPLQEEPATGVVPLPALRNLTSSGLDLHISNRSVPRDFEVLAGLAENARRKKGFMVYYHHGPLSPNMTGLASRGAWVHFSDRSLDGVAAEDMGLEIIKVARAAGSRAVVTVEQGLPLPVLEAFFEGGAAVLFRTPPSDDRSLQRPFERKAQRRGLPARASYLTATFLL
jgi:hypothetical protein